MILNNKLSKYLTYIILVAQVIALILAIEIGGWFAILYILINLGWAGGWCYKNFELLDNASDIILMQLKGKAYYKGKEIKPKKQKNKKKVI